MGTEDRPLRLRMLIGIPALIGTAIYILHIMPGGILAILTAWIMGSFPIGVLIGKCILSEPLTKCHPR